MPRCFPTDKCPLWPYRMEQPSLGPEVNISGQKKRIRVAISCLLSLNKCQGFHFEAELSTCLGTSMPQSEPDGSPS